MAPTTFRIDWGRGPFRVSKEREALRLQIVGDPYDDDLRRVYADMAIEEGDPRGEYVRLGLLLDQGGNTDVQARELERALEDLCARYGRAIFAEWFDSPLSKELPFLLRDHGATHAKVHGKRQRAGFIANMHLSHRRSAYIREAFSLTPIESASFPDPANVDYSIGKVRDFRSPTITLFEKFAVRPRRVFSAGAHDLTTLLSAVQCDDLRTLRLTASTPDDEAIAQFIQAAPLLRSLGGVRVSPRGARLLGELADLRELAITLLDDVTLDEDAFPNLNTLTLGGTYESLGELIAKREVESLVLHDAPTSRFLEMLDGAPLRSLTLRAIDEATLPVLAKLSLPTLKHLRLATPPIGEVACPIRNAPFASTVRSLEIFHARLSGEQLTELTESDLFANLETLDLSGNPIGSTGANALAACPHVTKIKSLKLQGARIGQGAMRTLLERLHSLEVLHVHVNDKNLRGLPLFAVAQMPHLGRVRDFSAEGGGSGANQAALIAFANSKNARALHRLRVGTISGKAMQALIDSPYLEALGEIGEFKPRGDKAIYQRALRRFGHRLIVAYALRRELPEPDLDPWWTPL